MKCCFLWPWFGWLTMRENNCLSILLTWAVVGTLVWAGQVYKSASEGFWPVMCTTVGGCTPETAARFRALGWCIAAALLNRLQFPFSFSRALMTQVRHGATPCMLRGLGVGCGVWVSPSCALVWGNC